MSSMTCRPTRARCTTCSVTLDLRLKVALSIVRLLSERTHWSPLCSDGSAINSMKSCQTPGRSTSPRGEALLFVEVTAVETAGWPSWNYHRVTPGLRGLDQMRLMPRLAIADIRVRERT